LLAGREVLPSPPERAYHRCGGAWRGDFGTVLPASARSTGTMTSSPDDLRIQNDSESAASSTPRTSAISSPGPVAAGRRQRTTTRLPTSSGVSRTSRRKYTRKWYYRPGGGQLSSVRVPRWAGAGSADLRWGCARMSFCWLLLRRPTQPITGRVGTGAHSTESSSERETFLRSHGVRDPG
jgi:hypothetical protein